MTHCGYTNWFPFVIESYPVLSNSFGRSYLVRRNTEPWSLSLSFVFILLKMFFFPHIIFTDYGFSSLCSSQFLLASSPIQILLLLSFFVSFVFCLFVLFFLYHCVPILLISSLTLFLALYSFVCDFFLF